MPHAPFLTFVNRKCHCQAATDSMDMSSATSYAGEAFLRRLADPAVRVRIRALWCGRPRLHLVPWGSGAGGGACTTTRPAFRRLAGPAVRIRIRALWCRRPRLHLISPASRSTCARNRWVRPSTTSCPSGLRMTLIGADERKRSVSQLTTKLRGGPPATTVRPQRERRNGSRNGPAPAGPPAVARPIARRAAAAAEERWCTSRSD